MKLTIIGRAVGPEGQHAEVRLPRVEESVVSAGLLSAIEDGLTAFFERAFEIAPASAVAVVLPYVEDLDEGRDEASIPSPAYTHGAE